MQKSPVYTDVVREVHEFLCRRVEVCDRAGIPLDRLMVDPGFGFGKTLQHNLALLEGLAEMRIADLPLLVGLSRKRMLGAITGREVQDRVHASVAAALFAAQRGAHMLRVHDVGATADALEVLSAVQTARVV